ncbi:CMP-sialic acid transporter 1 [Bienertia sinuspersici]
MTDNCLLYWFSQVVAQNQFNTDKAFYSRATFNYKKKKALNCEKIHAFCLGILTTLSQSNGGYKYDYATIPFLAEVLKVIFEEKVVKLAMVGNHFVGCWDNHKPVDAENGCMHQNQGEGKKVELTLMTSSSVKDVKGCGEASCDSLLSAPIQGYMLGILSACLSALAGVYTEFLLKKNNDSLYWQNVQLYAQWWRILGDWLVTPLPPNLGVEFDPPHGPREGGPMAHGVLEGGGAVYSTSMAMLLTMIVSIYLFDFKPTLQVYLCAYTILLLIYFLLYFSESSPLSTSRPEIFFLQLFGGFAAILGHHYMHDVIAHVFCSSKFAGGLACDCKTRAGESERGCCRKGEFLTSFYLKNAFFCLDALNQLMKVTDILIILVHALEGLIILANDSVAYVRVLQKIVLISILDRIC